MKSLYIECNMGAAGDMLMAALLELHPNPDNFIERLNLLGIPKVSIIQEKIKKSGISGTHIKVLVGDVEESEHMHEHHNHHHNAAHEHHSHNHSNMHSIEHIIGHLNLPEKVFNDVLAVYHIIAEAESKAHNCEIENIHFHEVGTMDAIADIVGVCMLVNELGIDKIFCSPINVGKGKVKCAHGILPVPAPATVYILQDVPIYNNDVEGELCTPTGAALLKHFVSEFKSLPIIKINKIGYGFGTKDFETVNCVRAFLGEADSKTDTIVELVCNVDDMTGERVGFAIDRIFASGAAEVFTTAVGMKKNRPGIMLTCICTEENRMNVVNAIFKYTTTIGIREKIQNRYILDRKESVMHTEYGDIRIKKSTGYDVVRIKPEYDDLYRAALENNIDISDIKL